MKIISSILSVFVGLCLGVMNCPAQDEMPFQHKVDVYRSAEGDVVAFTVRLEQAFLAEEFEKSNFLRLRSDDDRAWLIYPIFRRPAYPFFPVGHQTDCVNFVYIPRALKSSRSRSGSSSGIVASDSISLKPLSIACLSRLTA